jgi:hypothetical protein
MFVNRNFTNKLLDAASTPLNSFLIPIVSGYCSYANFARRFIKVKEPFEVTLS